MIYINPIPNLNWYCDTTPVPVAIVFSKGMYVISTPAETQSASTLVAAEQLGHDMVLAESAIVLSLAFKAFAIDNPSDGQLVYAIDPSKVITTGTFDLGDQLLLPSNGSTAIAVTALSGWCATS